MDFLIWWQLEVPSFIFRFAKRFNLVIGEYCSSQKNFLLAMLIRLLLLGFNVLFVVIFILQLIILPYSIFQIIL